MQEFSDSQKTYTPSENTEHDVSSCATMARVRKRLLPRVYIFFLFCKKYVCFQSLCTGILFLLRSCVSILREMMVLEFCHSGFISESIFSWHGIPPRKFDFLSFHTQRFPLPRSSRKTGVLF